MKQQNISLENKTILVTGAAGFIGSNLVMELVRMGKSMQIIGIDNMNDYYDVSIKEYRLSQIDAMAAEREDLSWTLVKGSIADKGLIDRILQSISPQWW